MVVIFSWFHKERVFYENLFPLIFYSVIIQKFIAGRNEAELGVGRRGAETPDRPEVVEQVGGINFRRKLSDDNDDGHVQLVAADGQGRVGPDSRLS